MLQKYDNWWQDKKLEDDLEKQQRCNQIYNEPPRSDVNINKYGKYSVHIIIYFRFRLERTI